MERPRRSEKLTRADITALDKYIKDVALTADEAAKDFGMHYTTLSRIRTAKRGNPESLKKIRRVLYPQTA